MQFGQLWVAGVLTLRSTQDGGRSGALVADREGSYRPNWSLGVPDPEAQTAAPVFVMNPTTLLPGESGVAVLVPFSPQAWVEVAVGTRLFLYEGPRACGELEVRAVWSVDDPQDEEIRAFAHRWASSEWDGPGRSRPPGAR